MNALSTDAPDRGSVTVWFAVSAFVMIIVVGVAVDLTGQVQAQQHARATAAEAARVGGQQLQRSAALSGAGTHLDTGQAVAAAQTYLAAAGVSGTAAVQGGTTVVVSTTDTYSTRFLSIVGLTSMTVSGQAEARIVRAIGGTEQ